MEVVFVVFVAIVLLHITTTLAGATGSSFNIVGSERDRVALLEFKSKIRQDPQGVMSLWNNSRHFCEWEGVTCGKRHRRVTILDLQSRGLVGSLSPYIGNLSFLKEIRLRNNTLQGEIPPEIGRLFRLQLLSLGFNSLEGEIPANLSHCSNLGIIGLPFNNLTGGIQPFIGNLTSLFFLSVSYNALGGSIPDALGRLLHLTILYLGGNNLYGTIPPSIYNLSFLTNLSLADNQLHGSLPQNLGRLLPHLESFQLRGNHFSGSIPPSLSNASKLDFVEMAQNNFTGKVSVDFRGLQNLWSLNLAENNLGSGEADEMIFLTSLANCSNLQELVLWRNQFRGELPKSVSNFSTHFRRLSLGYNQLFGRFPSWIGSLITLNVLRMNGNRFTGTIPNDIGKFQNLQELSLDDNMLSGKIPFPLGNLSLLNVVYLDNNRLQGAIPPALGNCQNLYVLYLSQNSLSGTIPKQLFNASALSISLNLAQNDLVGSLPLEIGNLDKLSELDVSDNKLSSELPTSLSRCTSLQNLYMEGNFFRGSIPLSLSSLRGIRNFDLSRNNLSGQIPSFLEKILLEKLNLSFNNLEGNIPMKGVFANASAISVVGNKRLCGGIPELQLPKCTVKESKRRVSFRLILIISAICAFIIVSIVSALLFCLFKREIKDHSLRSLLRESFLKVSYRTLLRSTNGFSSENLIGVGSFGFVYKGILDSDGTMVAVKVLNLQHRGASKSFVAECRALKNIRHRNLVKIITSCSSVDFQGNDFRALIYEFMPNGSLEKWLHPVLERNQNLNLLQRVNIAMDIACALEYLHHHCQKTIVHCDLKPSNILLDDDMTAKVGDFGLAKFLLELVNPNQSNSMGIRGTIGYTAPEYGLGSEVSTSGDVYSYGILLLEMMTGQRPTAGMFTEGLNLHNFAMMALPDRIIEIVDPILLNDLEEARVKQTSSSNGNRMVECLIFIINIGVACSMELPQDRMEISNVVQKLHLVRNTIQGSLHRQTE